MASLAIIARGLVLYQNGWQNNAAIETDVPGFGIELQHDGQRFKLNTPLAINATDFTQKPKLEAVPVKASDAVLSDTNFSAYATLRVDYQ